MKVMNHESALAKKIMLEPVWYRSNDTYRHDCLKKTTTFPRSFMIWGRVSRKGPGEMAPLRQQSMHRCTLKFCTLLIPSIENEMVMKSFFRMIMHLATEQSVKAFLLERHINSMTWPANSLNPIENFWWREKKKKG